MIDDMQVYIANLGKSFSSFYHRIMLFRHQFFEPGIHDNNKLGAAVTEIDISTEAYLTIQSVFEDADAVSYTHLRAHETS